VPESEVPSLFRSATVVLMPYASSTGASGVAHIACAYGVPMISADLPDFREMAEEEGLAIQFYPPAEPLKLADLLVNLLRTPRDAEADGDAELLRRPAHDYARVVYDYLRHFHFAHQTRALRPSMRVVGCRLGWRQAPRCRDCSDRVRMPIPIVHSLPSQEARSLPQRMVTVMVVDP